MIKSENEMLKLDREEFTIIIKRLEDVNLLRGECPFSVFEISCRTIDWEHCSVCSTLIGKEVSINDNKV